MDLPPAEALETALVELVQESCDAERVDVQWLGVSSDALPQEMERFVWEGDPCRRRPSLRAIPVHDGVPSSAISFRPRLDIWVEVPIAAKDLRAGEEVEATLGEARLDRLRDRPFRTEGLAKRSLQKGDPLVDLVVQQPYDVLEGAQVELSVTRGALTLTAPGRVLENGRTGDTVRVLNEATRTALDGVVVDSETIEIR